VLAAKEVFCPGLSGLLAVVAGALTEPFPMVGRVSDNLLAGALSVDPSSYDHNMSTHTTST